MVRARLKTSKTGVDFVVEKTGDAICPVSAMLNYLLARGAGPGPLFRFKDGKPLTKAQFVSQVREHCTQPELMGNQFGAQLPQREVGLEAEFA